MQTQRIGSNLFSAFAFAPLRQILKLMLLLTQIQTLRVNKALTHYRLALMLRVNMPLMTCDLKAMSHSLSVNKPSVLYMNKFSIYFSRESIIRIKFLIITKIDF